MKKHLFVIFSMFCILFLIGCGGKTEKTIIGKWEITKAEGAMAEINTGMIYEFVNETELVLEKSGFRNKATYKIEGDNLTYTISTITTKASLKMEGDKMTIKIQDSDQKFELVRK